MTPRVHLPKCPPNRGRRTALVVSWLFAYSIVTTNLHGGGQQIWIREQIAPSVTTVTVSPDILCTCLRDREVTLLVARQSFTTTFGCCRSERQTMPDKRNVSLSSI